jgi:tRNA(Met) C34 N-acetyltransferase TmcA
VLRQHLNNQNSTNIWNYYSSRDAYRMVRHSVHRHQQANLSTKIIASTKTSRQHTMPELYQGIYQSRGNTTSASAARGRAKRTFSAVAGAALPGEEAEGTLPRVRELAVRHPRLASPLLLSLPAQHKKAHQIRRKTNKSDSAVSTAAMKWLPPMGAANRGGRDGSVGLTSTGV